MQLSDVQAKKIDRAARSSLEQLAKTDVGRGLKADLKQFH